MRILDAAVNCLAEVGYPHASTVMIQRRAEVSRGGLLHHFRSKDLLLVAAAQHVAVSRVAQLTLEASAWHVAPDTPERIDKAIIVMWDCHEETYWQAATELWIAATHNENLRAALEPAERILNKAIHEAVSTMFGPTYAAHPNFPLVRDLLLTSMRGLAGAEAFGGRYARHARYLEKWTAVARAMLLDEKTTCHSNPGNSQP
jgi:AcrR family transcriptional regulator